MTQRLRHETAYPVPRERLFELITDPAFQEEKAKALGVLEARCTRVERPDGTILVAITECRPPAWGKEPSKSTLTVQWNPQTFVGQWTQSQHGYEGKARAEGTILLLDMGGGQSCNVIFLGELEIKVPFIGGMIEKKVLRYIEDEMKRDVDYTKSRLASG